MSTTRALKALVVGAGIGGRATAAALRADGHQVEVFERAGALAEVGAGLSMAPNALAALDRLGVGDEIRRRGGIARTILVRTRSGRVLSEIDAAGREWEVVGSTGLISRTCFCAPPARSAWARASSASSTPRTQLPRADLAEGDILVAADGINSTVRAQLRPREPCSRAGTSRFPASRLRHRQLSSRGCRFTIARPSRSGVVGV